MERQNIRSEDVRMKRKQEGMLLVILSGIFWGTMGLFVRRLGMYGFDSIQIVCLRLIVAAAVFSVILLMRDPSGFRISVKHIPLFLGLGLGSILFFTSCYFTAIRMMSMSAAAILLYTSPIWVMLMSCLFFREKITGRKVLALLCAFAGCILVSGIGTGGMTFFGLMIGLGAGLGYGLYSVLGTIALRSYSPYVVTTYTFVIAAAGSLLISRPAEMLRLIGQSSEHGSLILLIAATGIVTAVIPFMCYTLGLQSMEASRAAIIVTIEPLVATLLGWLVFHESLTPSSVIGMFGILAAIVILNSGQQCEKPVEGNDMMLGSKAPN